MRYYLAFAAPALLGLASGAAAQYRPDMPAMAPDRAGLPATNARSLAPDPDAPRAQAAERFRHWYAAAHRPTMLLFWNRELTDETATHYADVANSHEELNTSTSRDGFSAQHDSHQESFLRPLTGGQYEEINPMLSAQMETAFQGEWIDRSTLIRMTSTKAAVPDRSDLQMMESVALQKGVEYLVEVLPNPRADSPTGLVFMVRVKHLPSATLVAQFLTPAEPAAGPAHWVTTGNGYEKRRDNRTNPQTIGTQLAVEVMRRLAR